MTKLLALGAAQELLRMALLAKLAVDLDDPRLSRRAARHAQTQARLLGGLDFAPHRDDDDDSRPLPEVQDLLELAYPTAGGDL